MNIILLEAGYLLVSKMDSSSISLKRANAVVFGEEQQKLYCLISKT